MTTYRRWDDIPLAQLDTRTGWIRRGRVLKPGQEHHPDSNVSVRAQNYALYSLAQTETRFEATARRKEIYKPQ